MAFTFQQVLKDATAADVHVPSAGGDGKKPKKKPKGSGSAELSDGTITNTGKGDWTLPINITKVDSDAQQVFGWASVTSIGGRQVVDKQDDIIPIEELERAAYEFVLYSGEQDDMHKGGPVGRCIESMVFTPEKAARGLIAKNLDGEQVYGWFVGFQVDDPELWKAHKAGKRPEFSIGGSSSREEIA